MRALVTNIILRKATPNDSDFVYSVRKASFKGYVEKTESWDEDEQRWLHDRRFAQQDFRIVNFAGTDVEFFATDLEYGYLKVNQLMVLPEHQGKGVGRVCMLLTMAKASHLGLPVRLRVMKVNPRALAFYQRLGFICVTETDTHNLLEWTA